MVFLWILLSLSAISNAQPCRDFTYNNAPWHDSGGLQFTCTWYATLSRCLVEGNNLPFGGMTAKQACCVCGGGTRPLPVAPCVRDNAWIHPVFRDNCTDYDVGGRSRAYSCSDAEARRKCCLCSVVEPSLGYACVDKPLSAGVPWRDSEDFSCAFYERTNCINANNYSFGGMTSRRACCACGGGTTWQCTDRFLSSGYLWKDSRGYPCTQYKEQQLCFADGESYEMDEMTARQACCACGGGISTQAPRPDLGDDIEEEWMLGVIFKNKKHLAGDMVLYWNLDANSAFLPLESVNVPRGYITIGILGPASSTGWVYVGFSLNGTLGGTDAVVGYIDFRPSANNASRKQDVRIESNASSGVESSSRQQLFTNSSVGLVGGRIALVFTRPLFTADAVPIFPSLGPTTVMHAYGRVAAECSTPGVPLMCVPPATQRWSTKVFLNGSTYNGYSDLNAGQLGQPCQGTGNLKCVEGLYCIHRGATDPYAANYVSYGECADSASQTPSPQVQSIFLLDENGMFGGYQNRTVFPGGFELLWTVNRFSAPTDPWGLGDTIRIAFVSTGYDGWISIGFSPNGIMANSSAVFGYKDASDRMNIQDTFLMEAGVQSQSLKWTDPGRQQLLSKEVIREGTQTALVFERPLFPEDDVPITEELTHVIIAAGPAPLAATPNVFPFHTFWATYDVAFIQSTGVQSTQPTIAQPLAMSIGEFCGGPNLLRCEENATCRAFNRSLFSTTYNFVYEDSAGAFLESPYTAEASVFSPNSELLGRSVCVNASDTTVDLKEVLIPRVLNADEWQYNVSLKWGFTLFYRYLSDVTMELALKSTLGPGWVSLGFGSQMIGSVAIIGWIRNEETTIQEYRLRSYYPWNIFPSQEIDNNNKVDLFAADYILYLNANDMAVNYRGGETSIQFTMAVGSIIQPGTQQSIIYAGGRMPNEDNLLNYHSFRDVQNITFVPHLSA